MPVRVCKLNISFPKVCVLISFKMSACVCSKAQISAHNVCESHLRTHQYNTIKPKAEEQLGDQYEASCDGAGSHLVTLSV